MSVARKKKEGTLHLLFNRSSPFVQGSGGANSVPLWTDPPRIQEAPDGIASFFFGFQKSHLEGHTTILTVWKHLQ